MKKIFICATLVFSFLGITGCENEEVETGGKTKSVLQLTATPFSIEEIELTWKNPLDETFSYVTIQYHRDGEVIDTVIVVDPGVETYLIDGLTYQENKPYTFSVQSVSVEDEAGETARVKANPLSKMGAIAAVNNLRAEASRGSVTLHWDDPVDYNFAAVRVLYNSPEEGDIELEAYPGDGETGFTISGLLQKWGEIEFTLIPLDKYGNEGIYATISATCLRSELHRVEYREALPHDDALLRIHARGEYTFWHTLPGWRKPSCQEEYEYRAEAWKLANLVDGNENTFFGFIENYEYVYNVYEANLWGNVVVSQPWLDINIDPSLKGSFKAVDVTIKNAKGDTADEIDFSISWDVWVHSTNDNVLTDDNCGWMRLRDGQADEFYGEINLMTCWQRNVNIADGLEYDKTKTSYTDYLEQLSGAEHTISNICMPDGSEFNHVRLALMMGQDGDGDGTWCFDGDNELGNYVWLNLSHCRIAELRVDLVKERVTDPESDNPNKALTKAEIEAIEAEFAQSVIP